MVVARGDAAMKRSEREDAILADEAGRPIPRPLREECDSLVDFIRASHEFEMKVASIANAAFANQFAKSIRGNGRR
jgi:hypothetical protein